MKRELRCRDYVRYVDDFILFAEEKTTLWSWRAAILKRMARLRLTIQGGVHPRPVSEGLPFLGFVVYPDRRRLKRRKGIAFRRRLNRLIADCRAGSLAPERFEASVRGWVDHVRYGNTIGLSKALMAGVRPHPRGLCGRERADRFAAPITS